MIPQVVASETGTVQTYYINSYTELDASLTAGLRASMGYRVIGVVGTSQASPIRCTVIDEL